MSHAPVLSRHGVGTWRKEPDHGRQHGLEIAEAFFAASRNGDMNALNAMLAADVSLHADGGGKRSAALRPLFGKHGSTLVSTAMINGLPGFLTWEADGELQTTAFEIDNGMITAI